MLGCWITRVGVRCFVRCWKPNDLTRVGLILTCWVSNACWTENVSVIVRFKDVLFCSVLDSYFGCLAVACRVGWRGLLVPGPRVPGPRVPGPRSQGGPGPPIQSGAHLGSPDIF